MAFAAFCISVFNLFALYIGNSLFIFYDFVWIYCLSAEGTRQIASHSLKTIFTHSVVILAHSHRQMIL